MEISEVRIKLMEDPNERLLAFCSITLDGCFVIRDLKLISGKTGPFVAMPSRKLTDRCPKCQCKNHLRAAYCNQCGARLSDTRAAKDDAGRSRLYADIAHPINSTAREQIQNVLQTAFEKEVVLSQQPGYTCTYDDFGEEQFAEVEEQEFGFEPLRMNERVYHFDPAETTETSGSTVHGGENRQRQTGSKDDEFGAGLI